MTTRTRQKRRARRRLARWFAAHVARREKWRAQRAEIEAGIVEFVRKAVRDGREVTVIMHPDTVRDVFGAGRRVRKPVTVFSSMGEIRIRESTACERGKVTLIAPPKLPIFTAQRFRLPPTPYLDGI